MSHASITAQNFEWLEGLIECLDVLGCAWMSLVLLRRVLSDSVLVCNCALESVVLEVVKRWTSSRSQLVSRGACDVLLSTWRSFTGLSYSWKVK